jgi:hypothetical protein
VCAIGFMKHNNATRLNTRFVPVATIFLKTVNERKTAGSTMVCKRGEKCVRQQRLHLVVVVCDKIVKERKNNQFKFELK